MNQSITLKSGKRNLIFRNCSGRLLGILSPKKKIAEGNEKKIISQSLFKPVKAKKNL